MEISTRDLATVLHGMGFGALFMLAFSGAMVELFRLAALPAPVQPPSRAQTLLTVYLIGMVVLAWLPCSRVPTSSIPDIGVFLLPASPTYPNTRDDCCSRAAELLSGTISGWNGKRMLRGLRRSP
jgi:hypothetical protein